MELEYYEIVKILHIISLISWMAALLYLPRLFVYHSDKNITKETYETFLRMEKKLLFYISLPAMIATLTFGLLLAKEIGFNFPWLHIKILLVSCLVIFQTFLIYCFNNFKKETNKYSSKFFKIINELPTLLMIFIVIIIILKPSFE